MESCDWDPDDVVASSRKNNRGKAMNSLQAAWGWGEHQAVEYRSTAQQHRTGRDRFMAR